MIHHIDDLLHLIMRNLTITITQDLCKTHNNIKWCTDLMGHILNENRLLTVCLFRHPGGLHQLLVTAFGLLCSMTDITDMTFERLLHGGKAVLQPAYGITALCMRDMFIVIALGNNL